MGNVVDWLRAERRDFAARPFNEVDSLVLSQMAYAHMPGNVPGLGAGDADSAGDADRGDAGPGMVGVRELLRAECYDDMFGGVWSPALNVDLLRAVCESPRWRSLRVGAYVSEFDPQDTKQFAACSFEVGQGALYVAFRGTDSSIVGWNEDFAMAFRRPVAAQEAASRYLRAVAARWPGPIMVGGHSKGGNLAVYAAADAPQPVRDRIVAVFSHDGPGFDEAFRATDGYRAIGPLVHKSVPESSVIGMLFETGEGTDEAMGDGCTVVASAGTGIMQHFALNWRVADGAFVLADGVSSSSRYAAATLNEWMARTDDEHRRRFIDNLFAILESGGYATFGELSAHLPSALPAMLAAARGIDGHDREVILAVVKALASSAAASMLPERQ